MGTTAQKLKKVLENKKLIVDSVNTKAGTSFDINSKISDIVDAIENIEAGSSEDCEPTGEPLVVKELPDAPTAIPTNGHVENIYLNSELSFEEIHNMLSSLTYTDLSSYGLAVPTYIVFASINTETACLIQGEVDGDMSGYAISVIPDFLDVMDSGGNLSDYIVLSVMKDNTGIHGIFSPNIENPNYHGEYYALNDDVLNSFGGLSIGTENEKIKNLLSVTPFNKNINPNAIYALVESEAEAWTAMDGVLVNVGELAKEEGVNFEIHFVKDIPLAENMLPTLETDIHIYWIESENEGYLLLDGQVEKYSETIGIEMPVNGVVNSLDEIKNAGLYLLKLSNEKYYKYDNGWVELNAESGKIEIYEIGDTPIPTKGRVEYVLNNFSKTKEETIQILSSLSILNGETYVVLANADGSKRLTINRTNDIYSINNEKSVLWDGIEEEILIFYSFSDSASPTTVIDGENYQVGTKNEKLITLFTTKLDETMFTGGKLKLYELKENLVAEKEILFENGTYDLSKYLDENKIPFKISVDLPYATLKDYGYRGTPIITNPVIDKVYLNINLTPQEVREYLCGISTHYPAESTGGKEVFDQVFITDNFSLGVTSNSSSGEITHIKLTGNVNSVWTTFFEFYYSSNTGSGWKSDFDGIINVNEPETKSLLNMNNSKVPIGLKYTRLISGTPFVSGQELNGEYDTTPVSIDIYDSGEIDIVELVNKQKIPSKLTVNVTSDPSSEPVIIQSGKKAVPESGYVRRIYINSKLSREQINALCNQLTFVNNAYYVFLGEHFSDQLMISKISENEFHVYGTNNTMYYHPSTGWNVSSLDIHNKLILNDIQNESVKKIYPIGSENNILIDLFSTTPHYSESTEFKIPSGEYSGQNVEIQENGELNIISLIETNRNLPFNIDVNVKQGVPIEVDNELDMDMLLVPKNADKIFKYVGSTGKYKNESLYQVKKAVS